MRLRRSIPLFQVAREVRLAEDELRFYNAHGFLYLPAVVDPDACDVLREEVLEVCEKDPGINLTHQQLLDGSARDGGKASLSPSEFGARDGAFKVSIAVAPLPQANVLALSGGI